MFTTLLNNSPKNSWPSQYVKMVFYTSTLPLPISMFFKRVGKVSLVGKFEEEIKVEKEMINLKGNYE